MEKICTKHGQRVIIVDRSQTDPKAKNLCIQCLTEQKHYLMSYEDAQQELVTLRTQLIKEKQDLNQKNIDLLVGLKDSLWQLKIQISALIDKHIACFESQIQLILDSSNKYVKQIESLEISDLDQFVKLYLEVEKKFINYQDIKDLLLKNLSTLSSESLIQKSTEIFSKINTGMLYYSNEVLCNFKQQFALKQMDDTMNINLTCKEHKGCQIIMVDLNEISKCPSRLICVKCISAYPAKYVTIEEFKESWQNYLQEKQNYCSSYIEKVQIKIKEFNVLFSEIQQRIANLIAKSTNEVNERSNNLLNVLQNCWQQDKNFNISLTDYNEFEEFVEQMSGSKIIQHLIKYLECNYNQWNESNFKQISQIQQTLVICTENLQRSISIQLNGGKNINEQVEFNQNSQLDKQFTYEQIKVSSIKEDQICYAMSFNKDCSILVVGCLKQIKVFEFNNGMMNLIQLLNEHENYVQVLKFMKITNSFISGSYNDGQIIIWSMNSNNKWICQQKINAYSNSISCMILNNNEDLIISGSFDNKIKFWIKQNQWVCRQTITDHQNSVLSLSLNELQNRLISCSYDKQILIIDFSEEQKEWIIKQKIIIHDYCYRLCFINDNQFTLQRYKRNQLDIYELNDTNGQYIKTKDVQVKCGQDFGNCLFPQQYIKQKSLLVNKNGQYINLTKKQQNGQFITEHSIQFQSSTLYGCMSDDAEYLITWDEGSKEIQIRQYKEK